MRKSNLVKAVIYGVSALPLLAFAQPQVPGNIVNTYGDVTTLISTAANWILGILLAAAVVFILIAAFNYLTSGGDEKKVASAKKMVTYAIIAIALGLLARGVVALVLSFFGQSSINPPQ